MHHLNVAVIGFETSGKSTLVGRLYGAYGGKLEERQSLAHDTRYPKPFRRTCGQDAMHRMRWKRPPRRRRRRAGRTCRLHGSPTDP